MSQTLYNGKRPSKAASVFSPVSSQYSIDSDVALERCAALGRKLALFLFHGLLWIMILAVIGITFTNVGVTS
jgi:hypothetical protein